MDHSQRTRTLDDQKKAPCRSTLIVDVFRDVDALTGFYAYSILQGRPYPRTIEVYHPQSFIALESSLITQTLSLNGDILSVAVALSGAIN